MMVENLKKLDTKEKRTYAERQYRLGQKSIRLIASEVGVSYETIRKWIKKYSWLQDRRQEVIERTRAALVVTRPKKVDKIDTIDAGVDAGSREADEVSTEPATDEEMDNAVEVAVQTNLAVVRGHRQHLSDGLLTIAVLREQLHDVTQCRDRIIDQIMKEDVNHQRRAAMLKAVSLPSNAGVIRDLATALKHIIPLERQAFGLDEKAGPPPLPLADKLTDEQREALHKVADILAKVVTQQ